MPTVSNHSKLVIPHGHAESARYRARAPPVSFPLISARSTATRLLVELDAPPIPMTFPINPPMFSPRIPRRMPPSIEGGACKRWCGGEEVARLRETPVFRGEGVDRLVRLPGIILD